MIDRYNRKINYLRISVTDRCNLRCRYCMPKEGFKLLRHDQILSFEEIVTITKVAVDMGITKVRITGGEPLIRRGIVDLVSLLAEIKAIEDLAMTTNGILLAQYAEPLAQAGLDRVNISLDTTDAKRYRYLTRGGNINEVFAGIDAAIKAGLGPVKLNCVASTCSTEADIESVKDFGIARGIKVCLIEQMDFKTGCFSVVHGGSGGNCSICNRLRLSSDGKVRPCLFSDIFFRVRRLGPEKAIRLAVSNKPKAGAACSHTAMREIGG